MNARLTKAAEAATVAAARTTLPGEVAQAVVLGRVVEPYGLQGWCKVHLFGGDAAELGGMPQWWLAPAETLQHEGLMRGVAEVAAAWRAYPLLDLRPHGKGMIARFVGVDDRTAAEAIHGHFIAVPRAQLPEPAQGEYYWADLIGATVINQSGEHLGVVSELMSSGAHEVLCVRAGCGQERLLPFVAAVVKSVDLAATPRQITVAWELDW